MSTNSVKQLNIKESTLNLTKTYDFFDKTFSVFLNEVFEEFWEMSADIKLVGICEDENFFFQGSEYFVTRIKLSKTQNFVIRISKEIVRVLFDMVLGYNPEFEFEKITELEAKILTAFNNLIYTKFSSNLYSKEEVDYLISQGEEKPGECNFTFFIKDLSEPPAKIIVTVPKIFLKSEEVSAEQEIYGIEDFPTAKALVNLYVGSTTLPLNDVKNIEKEDIILLEKSNINNMTLNFEDNEIGFKVSPDPSLIISFDDNNEDNKNMSNKNDIWDNIQVELSAEFENVKISLGEIKQITEGLVLDLGSIYENKVFLKVENKVIAEGELVIINDRYGVRVDKILDDKKSSEPEAVVSQPEQEEISQQKEQEISSEQGGNNEEFDYKDFDVDDENI